MSQSTLNDFFARRVVSSRHVKETQPKKKSRQATIASLAKVTDIDDVKISKIILERAIKRNDEESIYKYLKQCEDYFISEDINKITNITETVGQLKDSTNAKIAELATELLDKWNKNIKEAIKRSERHKLLKKQKLL